jgi:hypothetical protein
MKKQWGHWTLITSTWVLRFNNAGWEYEIDLETITSSSQMLDWIFQVLGKSYICGDDITNLLHALRELFDPQANLCSFGSDKRINNIPSHIRREIKRRNGPPSASRRKIVQS